MIVIFVDIHLFAAFIHSSVCSIHSYSSVRSFVHSFSRSSVLSFISSFAHSCVRSHGEFNVVRNNLRYGFTAFRLYGRYPGYRLFTKDSRYPMAGLRLCLTMAPLFVLDYRKRTGVNGCLGMTSAAVLCVQEKIANMSN